MKKQYIAPDLTAVVFRAERGYAASLIDNVASRINGVAYGEEGYESFELVQGEGWGDGGYQGVDGYNTGEDGDNGLAAGYFGTGNTSGWF